MLEMWIAKENKECEDTVGGWLYKLTPEYVDTLMMDGESTMEEKHACFYFKHERDIVDYYTQICHLDMWIAKENKECEDTVGGWVYKREKEIIRIVLDGNQVEMRMSVFDFYKDREDEINSYCEQICRLDAWIAKREQGM